jgi:multidrug/hemolysin transport system permease protein
MGSLKAMTIRNIKMYYRHPSNVFFSMLAIIILLGLHFIVFRNVFTDNWVHIVSQMPGLDVPRADLQWLTDSLMFAAVLPIGAVTIALSTLGLMVSDREEGVFADFMTAPFSRNKLLASYLLSSFIISGIILFGFLVCFEIYFVLVYDISFSFAQEAQIASIILGSLVFANVFMLLLISFFTMDEEIDIVCNSLMVD